MRFKTRDQRNDINPIITVEEKIICKERSQGTFCFMIKTAKEDTKDPIQHSEVNIKAE